MGTGAGFKGKFPPVSADLATAAASILLRLLLLTDLMMALQMSSRLMLRISSRASMTTSRMSVVISVANWLLATPGFELEF